MIVCIHIHICTQIYTDIHIYKHKSICIPADTQHHRHVYTHTFTCMCTHTYAQRHTHTYGIAIYLSFDRSPSIHKACSL